MYGPALGLPPALSGVNSYYLRGYGDLPPEVLIVIGYRREEIAPYFGSCEVAGLISNRYGVKNEESRAPDIFVCRQMRKTWDDFWENLHHFG